MRQKLQEIFTKYRELISFLVTGVMVTCVNWSVYGFLIVVWEWNITFCNAASWFAATIAAFLLNKIFVFRSRVWHPAVVVREGLLFFCSRVLAGAAEIALLPLLIYCGIDQAVFGIKGFAAKFLAGAIATVIGFILSKYTVFRKPSQLLEDVSVFVEFHADDYALFPMQSERIMKCREKGVLNAISVMTTSPYLKECMTALPPDRGGLRLAVHLNFMEGKSLVFPASSCLTDGNGVFHVTFGKLLLASYLPWRGRWRAAFRAEIRAQIQAALPYLHGVPLRIDGHAHYHMTPVVFDALMDVIKEDGLEVSYIRIPREYVGLYWKNRKHLTGFRAINLLKVMVLNALVWRNNLHYHSFLSELEQDVFLGVLFSGNMCSQNVSALLADAKRLAARKKCGVEILAHPGGVYEPADLAQLTHPDDAAFLSSEARNTEAAMFCTLSADDGKEKDLL